MTATEGTATAGIYPVPTAMAGSALAPSSTAPQKPFGVASAPYAQAGQPVPPVVYVVQSWNGPPEQLAELLAEIQRADS